MKQHSPAAERNREPIREVLARELPASGTVLMIAEGSGQHAAYFAGAFPQLVWQPSDPSAEARASIAAWGEGIPNFRSPIDLDVTRSDWPAADAITCINMIHISPWEATVGLFAGAARTLAPGQLLFTYGPYRFGGATAPSNEAFDLSLRSRDPRWGIRDVAELERAAPGFTLAQTIALPANNHALVWRANPR
ncbi:MAG TPA: DUF938 domain-containing protein [Kofleriaceae bacterium]